MTSANTAIDMSTARKVATNELFYREEKIDTQNRTLLLGGPILFVFIGLSILLITLFTSLINYLI